MVHLVSNFPSTSRDTYGSTMTYSTWSGPPPLAKIGPGRARLLKLAPAALHCLLNLVLDSCLIIGSRGSGAALVRDGRGRTDVLVLIVMSVVAAVPARDGPFPPSVGLIVATCPTQWQCLCLKHILLCLGRLEGGSPWRYGRRWSQFAPSRKRGAVSPFYF